MQPTDDSELLRQYAENHSDEAFATLATRHINLVYSVALRHIGDPHHAEEITQAVFIILARKALQLRHDKALSSWLFQTTRLTANNFVRSEARRHRREQEAYMQTTLNESGNEIWPRIAPMLDTAVAGLNEKDRRAIVLRYYEGRNLREVGVALGASEEAAKKRVNRAVEKLQKFFFKRGVTSTTATIAGAISANSVQAAPVTLAKSISAVAMAQGATASASILTLIKGVLKPVVTFAGGTFGALLGGSYFGFRGEIKAAKSPRERQFMVRLVWIRVTIGVLLFAFAFAIRTLTVMAQPGAKPIAFAGFLFCLAVYLAAMFEYSNHRRRLIQKEDGTWVESDWVRRGHHDGLLTSVFDNTDKGNAYAALSVAFVMAGLVIGVAFWTAQLVTAGHWILALIILMLGGMGVIRAIRAWRKRPRFDALLGTLVKGVGGCGLFTLAVYDLSWVHGTLNETHQWAIAYNIIVVLAYVTVIGILAWLHRLPSAPADFSSTLTQ